MDYILLKKKALDLRKRGSSYSEILKMVPVAKSTLSLWLRSVGLAKHQKQRISEKKRLASLRGGEARKKQRITITRDVFNNAIKDVGIVSKRELFIIGVMLYWAEGSKEKDYKPGSPVTFSNSDCRMVQIFIKWLMISCNVPVIDITYELYIHENTFYRIDEVERFWRAKLSLPVDYFLKIRYKRHTPKTNRRNRGKQYYGCLRVKVKKSSILLRKIDAWTHAIVDSQWGIV